jgi:hypothetical protein
VRHWLGRRWSELCGFATSATNGFIAGASFLVPGLAARPGARRSPCILRDIRTGPRKQARAKDAAQCGMGARRRRRAEMLMSSTLSGIRLARSGKGGMDAF